MVMMQLLGLVFDTTSSNSGKDIGACKLLEVFLPLEDHLLSSVFQLAEEELLQVATLTKFILLHYTKYWFTTPLESPLHAATSTSWAGCSSAGGRTRAWPGTSSSLATGTSGT